MLTSFHTSTATMHQPNSVAVHPIRSVSLPIITSRAHTTTAIRAREHSSRIISAREQEILHLIAYEYSSKEIAAKLYISRETVNSHRKNIMVKLGVKNTAGMVRVAFEKQLLNIVYP